VDGNCLLFLHQWPVSARQKSGAETGLIKDARLKTQPAPMVAMELNLDGFDAAHMRPDSALSLLKFRRQLGALIC
jgi:hypothetical protein